MVLLILLLTGCKDAAVDTGCAALVSGWADRDGDGFGDPASPVEACEVLPEGAVDNAADCDDAAAAALPGGEEVCDGVDNDCDGAVDGPDTPGAVPWAADADRDGYGDPDVLVTDCAPPQGYVAAPADASEADCDDADPTVHPDAPEFCDPDGVDEDCDGLVNDDDTPVDALRWYPDLDRDGHGDPAGAVEACEAPAGYVSAGGDCDDGDRDIHPGEPEVCDDVDNDCDGLTDEEDAGLVDATAWYADTDDDGYGDDGAALLSCERPFGYVALGGDCDDADKEVHPLVEDVCDGVDNDCDGVPDPDRFSLDFSTAVPTTTLSINGDAWQDTTNGWLVLTDVDLDLAGSAFFVEPVPGDVWRVSFDLYIGDGSGAEGAALLFLSETDPTQVGSGGSGLGWAGLSGWAVEFDTALSSDTSDPDGNHVAVMRDNSSNHSRFGSSVPTLDDSQWRAVEVEMTGGGLQVWMDGTRVLNTTVSRYALPDALIGFSASTGSSATDAHYVDNVVLGCP
ncbi:MAG: hypothetical protein H6739_08630 [Alphaproteobacteria bacterium]|nr:hypothetical protein [Alphaproteobacteria bacterium]